MWSLNEGCEGRCNLGLFSDGPSNVWGDHWSENQNQDYRKYDRF